MKQKNISRAGIIVAFMLCIPFVGMLVSDEWNWGLGDFVVMGTLLFCAGLVYEFFASRANTTTKQKICIGLGVVLALLIIWAQLAVGAVAQMVRSLFI